jgi:streptogramin lyase
VVFVMVVLALGLTTVLRPNPSAATEGAEAPAASVGSESPYGIGVDPARRWENDPMALEAVQAPVVLVEHADFPCPFCGVLSGCAPATFDEAEVESSRRELVDDERDR